MKKIKRIKNTHGYIYKDKNIDGEEITIFSTKQDNSLGRKILRIHDNNYNRVRGFIFYMVLGIEEVKHEKLQLLLMQRIR